MPRISEKDLDRLQKSIEELSALNEIATAINSSMTVDEITHVILTRCLKRIRAAQGAVFLLDDDRAELDKAHTFVRESVDADQALPFHFSKSLIGWVIKNKTVLVINDPSQDERFSGDDLSVTGMTSLLAVPLVSRAGLIGVLALFNKQGDDGFDESDMRFFGIVGTQTAKVIENARLVEREAEFVAKVHKQRLESMSKFIAGIAHEFNNPIGAVIGSTDLLTRAARILAENIERSGVDVMKVMPEVQKPLQAISESVRVIESGNTRLAKIVDRLENFALLDRAEVQPIDVNESLNDCLAMVKYQLGERIRVVRKYGSVPLITCDSAQINQVFFNILMNAIEAIAHQGTITISTSVEDGSIQVEIGDSGAGIPEGDLDKIFSPGFTRKGTGVGTGLGLSISYQVVRYHNGRLDVESKLGRGTTVRVKLPTVPVSPPSDS
jgi:signal transduction histidine kinase